MIVEAGTRRKPSERKQQQETRRDRDHRRTRPREHGRTFPFPTEPFPQSAAFVFQTVDAGSQRVEGGEPVASLETLLQSPEPLTHVGAAQIVADPVQRFAQLAVLCRESIDLLTNGCRERFHLRNERRTTLRLLFQEGQFLVECGRIELADALFEQIGANGEFPGGCRSIGKRSVDRLEPAAEVRALVP